MTDDEESVVGTFCGITAHPEGESAMAHHLHWSQKAKRERRVFLTSELPEETIEAIRATRMDPKYDYWNDELMGQDQDEDSIRETAKAEAAQRNGQDLVNVMQACARTTAERIEAMHNQRGGDSGA